MRNSIPVVLVFLALSLSSTPAHLRNQGLENLFESAQVLFQLAQAPGAGSSARRKKTPSRQPDPPPSFQPLKRLVPPKKRPQ